MNRVFSGSDSIPDKSMIAVYTSTTHIKDVDNKDKSVTIQAVSVNGKQEEGRLLVRVDDKSKSVAAYVSFDMLFEAINTIIQMSIKGEYTKVVDRVIDQIAPTDVYADPFADEVVTKENDEATNPFTYGCDREPTLAKRRFVRKKE